MDLPFEHTLGSALGLLDGPQGVYAGSTRGLRAVYAEGFTDALLIKFGQ